MDRLAEIEAELGASDSSDEMNFEEAMKEVAQGADPIPEEEEQFLIEGVEDLPAIELMTPPARAKILTSLVGVQGLRTASEVADLAEIDITTFYDHKDLLMEYEILESPRRIGNSDMYHLNPDSELVNAFKKFVQTAGVTHSQTVAPKRLSGQEDDNIE